MITIIHHKKYQEIIWRQAKEAQKKWDKLLVKKFDPNTIYCRMLDGGYVQDVTFECCEALEKYDGTNRIMQIVFIPVDEKENQNLLQVVTINSRGASLFLLEDLPHIFYYDEEKIIKNIFK